MAIAGRGGYKGVISRKSHSQTNSQILKCSQYRSDQPKADSQMQILQENSLDAGFGVLADQAGPEGSSRNTSNNGRRGRRIERRHAVVRVAHHEYKSTGVRATFDGVCYCGMPVSSLVAVKSDGVSCWPSGVASCGLIWVCPVCAAKIKARRAVEIEGATTGHIGAGGTLAMLTMTVRHTREMPLVDVLRAVREAWARLKRLKSWSDLSEVLEGQVRALEVTVGVNGWHPHQHLLLFVRPGVDAGELNARLPAVCADWRRLVFKFLGVSPSVERGVHLLSFGMDSAGIAAGYLSKVANEISGPNAKVGSDPFSLLDDIDDVESYARWIEYADGMKGARAFGFSKGLLERFGGVEMTEEEIAGADSEVGGVVAYIEADDWVKALRAGVTDQWMCEFELVLAQGFLPFLEVAGGRSA